MNERIKQSLEKLFDQHRIIFWYDAKHELRNDYDALTLQDVEKREINHNELGLKYELLRDKPKQKFLLYKASEQPSDLDNWLLDIQLAEGEFRTDQAAIWLSELELPYHAFQSITRDHSAFFGSNKRIQSLKNRLKPKDTLSQVRLHMIAVCVESDDAIDPILEKLLEELADNKHTRINLLQRCQLDSVLWPLLERHYGYTSPTPTLHDFVLTLFAWTYYHALGEADQHNFAPLNGDALVFLKRWQDSRQHQPTFEKHSADCAHILNIEHDLHRRSIDQLIDLNTFELIDNKLITDLVAAVEKRTEKPADIARWCSQRQLSHWYDHFKTRYQAVQVASEFFNLLDNLQLHSASASEAISHYTQQGYKVDQYYRQYMHALTVSGSVSLFHNLTQAIENAYTNRFVLPLSNTWQAHIDGLSRWQIQGIQPQQQFFNQQVKPFLAKKKKVYVIISDAFRFEAAEEMLSRIRQEDRYQASLNHQLSPLPSYTQLGMAALLPDAEQVEALSIQHDKSAMVSLSGQSTQGTANRDKILKAALGERAAAMPSQTFMDMTLTEGRQTLKQHDVMYFYHNRIDHTGDKMQSEGEAFVATEKTFQDLMQLIKKLTSANANNILITADHGFLYQHQALADSDFLECKPHQEQYRDRRFLLGQSLANNAGMKHFSYAQLGLTGEGEAAFPKGIQRLRLQGSGSRFVHGGASLQEVITPIIKINKQRQSDTQVVDVSIINSGSNTITSGQLAITLYQDEAVNDKVHPRQLRCGLYNDRNQLVSDLHEVMMDSTADNPRERETKLQFILTQAADQENGKTITLRLDEPVKETVHVKTYKSINYTLQRSFTSDFDF